MSVLMPVISMHIAHPVSGLYTLSQPKNADSLKAVIGSGASSKVWIARTDGESKAVAVKIYKSSDYDDTAYRVSLLSEILEASTSESARYVSPVTVSPFDAP